MLLSNRLKMMEKFEFYCPVRDDDVRLDKSGLEKLFKSRLLDFCSVHII